MERLTADQILSIVEQNYSVSEFAHGLWEKAESINFDSYSHNDKVGRRKHALATLGLGRVETVEIEDFYLTHFVDHDVYIKTQYFYSSYSGERFYDYGKEVRPVTKTITVYE